MQKFNKISIIIVNYHSEYYLDKCIASVYAQSDPQKFEIIVVNNDTKTQLHEIAEKYAKIKIYNYGTNSGFGKACNYGAKKASGDILLFLNPDTQFLDNYVDSILNKFAASKENIGVIGPRLITEEGVLQEWCAGKELTVWRLIKNNFRIIESRAIWESKKEALADWVSGAALAIKRDIFEKIGGFDEKFFMYIEDMDLCFQAKKINQEVLYCPEFSILHSCGKSRESLLRQKKQFFKSSLYFLFKKYKSE